MPGGRPVQSQKADTLRGVTGHDAGGHSGPSNRKRERGKPKGKLRMTVNKEGGRAEEKPPAEDDPLERKEEERLALAARRSHLEKGFFYHESISKAKPLPGAILPVKSGNEGTSKN